MAVVDKTGRRVLLIISSVLMSLCFIGLSIFFFMKDTNKESVTNIGWLPLVLIATYISAFSIGFGPIPWVVMGEIFSTEVCSGFVNHLLCHMIKNIIILLNIILKYKNIITNSCIFRLNHTVRV